MEKMSQLIMRTEIMARKAVLSKSDDNNLLNLKTKLLFLLFCGLSSPLDITSELCINKCNLASLTRELASDEMIVKRRGTRDRREVRIAITKKGADYLDGCLAKIDASCKSAFGGGYDEASEKLSTALEVLEFI